MGKSRLDGDAIRAYVYLFLFLLVTGATVVPYLRMVVIVIGVVFDEFFVRMCVRV